MSGCDSDPGAGAHPDPEQGARGPSDDDGGLEERIARWIREYDAQGIHRTGTDGDRRSAEWMAQIARSHGLEPMLEELPFERLDARSAFVELPGAGGVKRVDGIPLYDAPPTGPEGVRGALGGFDSDAAIGFGPVGPHTSYTPGYFAARPSSRQRAHLAITGGPAFGLPPGYSLANAEHWGAPQGPPTLQLPSEAGEKVAAAAGREVRVVVDTARTPTVVHNVSVALPGSHAALAPVVVMTPRSGWWQCASERGGGIAAWLELVRSFARAPAERAVHFVASTGHELGHYGLDCYLAQRPERIAGAAAWIHLGASFAAAVAPQVRLQASDGELLARARELLGEQGVPPDVETPPGERPFGEARDIFDGGGRYVSLLGRNGLFHHPDDRWPQAVDLDRTARRVRAVVALARELARG
ncbi:MAG TPA: hypothetical protein VMV46_09880 [Thermoanaerobaculia bacterium]|nr:hypothetical protein [Thermoanaerobaculia bacterium]